MTNYFIDSNQLNFDYFQNYIQLKYNNNFPKIKWLTSFVESTSIVEPDLIFSKHHIDLMIVNIHMLEYPLSSAYRVVSVIEAKNETGSWKYAIAVKKEVYESFNALIEDDLRKNYGKVFITGFGPGDPDLLTIKALKAIQNADVIFFDSLINKDFLDRFNVEKVFVGKRKGNHTYGQNDIDEMLYQSAISGKNTVRLKGGDPFIFGRGGEEFDYLRKRFVEVEVIPGITSAFGAAASLGISLTQRLISSSVAFCTGYPKEDRRIPDADTLVFYMSASNLKETAQILIKSGRKAETLVALIRNATLLDQESQFSTLIELANGKAGLESPMVAIIGDVAIDKNIF